MSERIVYWKALADFSKVRKEAAKTQASLKALEEQADRTTASNSELGRSEDTVAQKTKKSGEAVSSAYSRVADAKEKVRKETERLNVATGEEVKNSRLSATEAARSAKAREAEAKAQGAVTAATQRLSNARSEQERATRKVANAENELAKAQTRQGSNAREIEAATKRLAAARDQEARASERAKTAAVSFSQAQQRLASVQATNAFEAQKAAETIAKAEERKAKAAEDASKRQQAAIDKAHNAAVKEDAARQKAAAIEAKRQASEQKRADESLRRTVERNTKLIAEYERLSAARQAAESVARRTPSGATGSVDQERLATVQSAIQRKPETLYSSSQLKAVNALARAEAQLKAAHDNEVSSYNRLYEAEQGLAVARSNTVQANHQLIASEAEYADAVKAHGEGSAKALEADTKRQGALRDVERALNAERSAENTATRVRQGATTATDRVTSATTRMGTAIRNADREFKASSGGGNIFVRALRSVGNGFNDIDKSAGRALHKLRGFFWPALAGGAYLLVAALSSLVSGLFALGSAVAPAVGAVAALGPALYAVAGAAGSVMAAFSGVGGVLKAYQQSQLAAAKGSGQAAKTELNNADQVKSAQRSLNDAREQVGITARNVADNIAQAAHQVVQADRDQLDAVKSLDQARKDAKKNILDLKNAVLDAALAERGAMLDLADAQDNLQKVLADPNSTRADRERAQLQVDQAKQSSKEAQQSTTDAKTASTNASTAGVEGDSGVVAAKRQLADANYQAAQAQKAYNEALVDGARENRKAVQAVTQAQESLAKAQRQATTATGTAATAASTYQAKLAALSPAAQAFVKKLISMQSYLKQLKATAASNMFPGLTRGLDQLPKLFPVINSGVASISREVGTLGERFANMITTPRWISAFQQLNKASTPILDNLGSAALSVADALRAVTVAAIPLATQLSKGIAEFASNLDKSADAAQRSGRLTKFFDRTYVVLHQLGQILKNVITIFRNLGGAASQSGQDILDSILAITDKWKRWTGEVHGQNVLKKFFADARENMREVDRLLGKLALGFLKMGTSKSLQPILKGLEDIGSAIAGAFKGNTGLVQDIADILHNVADIIRSISENSAGLKVFLSILGGFAKAASAVLAFKPAAVALGLFLGVFAAFKALKFVGSITGLTKLGKALKNFREEAKQTGGVLSTLKSKFNNLPGVRQLRARRAARAAGTGLGDDTGAVGGSGAPAPTPAGGAASRSRRRAAAVARRARLVEDPTNRIIGGTDERLGGGTLPGAGARGPVPGEGEPAPRQSRFARLRARLPRGDRGSASAGLLGTGGLGFLGGRSEGEPRAPRTGRMRGLGRGAAMAGGIGLGVAGMAVGDMINDHRGGARQAVGGAISGAASGAMMGAMFGPIGMGVGALAGGIVGLLQNSKIGQKIKQWFLKTVWPAIKALPGKMVEFGKDMLKWIAWPFTQAYKVVTEKLGPVSRIIKDIFEGVSAYFKGVFTFWKNLFLGVFGIIKAIVTGNFGDIWKNIKLIWDGVWAYLKGVWGLIKGLAKATFEYLKTAITLPMKAIWALIKLVWNGIKAYLKLEWTALKVFASAIWGGIKDGIVNPIKAAFSAVKTAWSAMWGWLKGAWNTAKSVAKTTWNAIADAVTGAFGGVGQALGKVWDGIERIFASAINFVTQSIINKLIGAINWVITKFGMDPIGKIGKIEVGSSSSTRNLGGPRASSGRATTAADGNVLPGYSPGSDTRTFVDQHGYKIKLSGGEGILTPETTRALGGKSGIDALNAAHSPRLRSKPRFKKAMRNAGMEAHADGGLSLGPAQSGTEDQRVGYNKFALWRFLKKVESSSSGGFLSGVGDAFSSAMGLIRKGAGAVVKGTFEGLEAPARFLIDKIPNVGFLKGLMNGFFDKVNTGVYDVIAGTNKKSSTKIADDAVYSGHVSGTSAQNDVMVSGLTLNNMTDNSLDKANYRDRMVSAHASQINALRTIISNESGWDASVVNRTDSNAKAGHPSQGLMQTIPTTFEAHKNPNLHRGILDAVANVAAGINYANGRYGSLENVPGVKAVASGEKYVGYANGGEVQSFHTGGVVKGINKGSNNSALSGIIAQAGLGFPSGASKWSTGLTNQFKKRLAGVNKFTDVSSGAQPTVQSLLAPDSAITKELMNWVDRHDPRSYGALWSQQPYGRSNSWSNKYKRNPILPILSYLGGSKAWDTYRTGVDSRYWASVTDKDRRADKAHKRKGQKYDLASEKKRHPKAARAIARGDAEWKRSLALLKKAVNTQKSRMKGVRSYLGLGGEGSNAGMFSGDMVNPLDHAAAHALGIEHPADWQHPWSGPVSATETALAEQDRSNALNAEWTADLTTLSNWGLPNLVDFLLNKGISDGMTLARSAVKDRKTAEQLNASIGAGLAAGSTEDQTNIIKIVGKLASGTATRPFGLRDISSYLNVPDYSVVNLFDKMQAQLAKIPQTLTSKFTNDVQLFRQGVFYANSGAIVPGDKSKNRDVVPAMLTPGEGVLNRKAMDLIGESDFNKLNNGVKPQYFANGGIVLAPNVSTASLGAAAGMTANGRNATSQGGIFGGNNITLQTNIYNPTGENSVYTMNRNLRRQAALGIVEKAAGAK